MHITKHESRCHQEFEASRERVASGVYTNTHHPKACLCTLCLSGEEPERCAYCQCVEVGERGDFCSNECEALDVADANDDQATLEQLDGEVRS